MPTVAVGASESGQPAFGREHGVPLCGAAGRVGHLVAAGSSPLRSRPFEVISRVAPGAWPTLRRVAEAALPFRCGRFAQRNAAAPADIAAAQTRHPRPHQITAAAVGIAAAPGGRLMSHISCTGVEAKRCSQHVPGGKATANLPATGWSSTGLVATYTSLPITTLRHDDARSIVRRGCKRSRSPSRA